LYISERMSFRYRNWVFRDCSVRIETRQIGLVGKNGCGKTTFLKLLDQQLSPQEGSIRVQGLTYMLDFDLTSYKSFWSTDIIALCSRLKSFDTRQADMIAERLNMVEYLTTPIGELSKGTAKKVTLLMGFMSTADVLLVDEPFESLDEESSTAVAEMFSRRDGAHIIVSHDTRLLSQCVGSLWTIKDKQLQEVK